MSRLGGDDDNHENGFPRVSGDEPFPWSYYMSLVRFSPRERG